jgi:LPXTG-motif cell wall-anchored protein
MMGLIAVVLVCLTGSVARAQTTAGQPVNLTFSGPVSVPGHTLPAGKYMFKLMNGKVDRDDVQIYDASGKTVAIARAMPAARADGDPLPEKPEVNFYETSPGVAQAVRMWWYPGIRTGGHEFIYPRAQALQIAKATSASVLTTAGEDGAGKLVRVTSNGETDLDGKSTGNAPSPTPADTLASAATAPTANRRALPKTASEQPLIAVLGFVTLFAGVALLSRRRAA